MSGIVYIPQPDHKCTPPSGDITDALNYRHYPAGTVWECDCRATWVSLGMVKPYTPTGHVSASLEWKREGKRARRKRERQGVTPEQVFDRGQRRHPTNVVPPPLSTKSTPAPSGILGQGYSGGKPARLVGLPPPVPSAATPRLSIGEVVSTLAKFEAAQRDGRVTVAESAAPAHPVLPIHNREITDRLKAAERCVLALTEALTGEAHDGVFDYDQAREHLLPLIHARRSPSALPRIGETVSHAGWVGTVKRVTFDASMDAATLVATSDPIIDAGHVVAVQPPRGVTVTDRLGHEWVRLADAWMSQHDGSARDWPYLIEQCGPLRTKWSESKCPAQQPATPVE